MDFPVVRSMTGPHAINKSMQPTCSW